MILDLNGKLKLDYNEISISIKDDGSILVYDRIEMKYYIGKDGKTEGPFTNDDPRVQAFRQDDGESNQGANQWEAKFPENITRSGDKYTIRVNGKSYGPFARINDFAVAKSGDKFAALVTENDFTSEDKMKKMEEAMKNAKTDQERMQIQMKFSQQVSQQMIQAGGAEAFQPKLVSDVPGAVYDQVKWMGGMLNGTAKFDDIVVVTYDKVLDLKGNLLLQLKPGSTGSGDFFINSTNSGYANYKYGTLTFSDNTTLSELFTPRLVKQEGKVSLSYMYYSPGRNAVMQCAVPF
jgi:hypothetical protein